MEARFPVNEADLAIIHPLPITAQEPAEMMKHQGPVVGPAHPAIQARYEEQGGVVPWRSPNPYPAGSAAAAWWQRGNDRREIGRTPEMSI